MRKSFNIVSLSVLFVISLLGCKKEDQSRLQASWTSKDPVIIPLNTRLHQYDLKNLAPNSSFESGKLFYEESNIKTFDIDGWKKIGSNIEWVNKQNLDYKPCEVFDGIHSVKIQRQVAHETEDLGEGILSDYIKVIPGNYFLKMHLKLNNIKSYKERLGGKLYDAVNIRLIYFDKNKIQIDAKEFNPFESKNIDNSFASLSFINYWDIDSLNWCEVHGKTASFPYFNGDIPDQARYVKIFVGLKGTGTLWIDKVDFRYTNQNFALLERLKPYFDSSFTVYDMLLPTPKQIEAKNAISYFNSKDNLLPIIVLEDNSLLSIANKLKREIETKITDKQKIKIVKNLTIDDVKKYSVVLSIGKNSIYKHYQSTLPDSLLFKHTSSYYIKSDLEENILFVNANDQESLYNGVLTLIQLLDKNKAVLHSANIFDFPDFKTRGYIIPSRNKLAAEAKSWILLKEAKLNNPYFSINSITTEQIKDYNKISLIIDNDYAKALESIRTIDKQVFNKTESALISNTVGDLKQLNHIIKILKRKNKSIQIELLPEFYNLDQINKSKGKADRYFENLHNTLPVDVAMIWTGENKCSNSIDYLNINQINNLVKDQSIYLDNNFSKSDFRFHAEYLKQYYSGKLRVSSLFEPYNFNAPENFHKYTKGAKIILKLDSITEFSSISALTTANYYWNTTDYNPEKSLWIALNKLYGRDMAVILLKFNDAFFGINEICQKIENNGINNKDIRIAKVFKNSLIEQYNLLLYEISDESLLAQIEQVKRDVLNKYDKVFLDVK
ncbi:MAG: beta-N-acetylglucosaminidase domain-containing protein [Bacteroidales bacterium]|nr:beta-N-acetylglucosaminidase domain-containing protein [Bacteroidales bacterium]